MDHVNSCPMLRGIDPQPLLDQVAAHPELWDIDDAWTRNKQQSAIYKVSNIVLRFNRSPDWDRAAFTILSEARPLVNALMHAIDGNLLGKVLITKLRPGEYIKPHPDRMPDGIPLVYQNFQIPLSVPEECFFGVGREVVHTKPGLAYWFNNQEWHWVINNNHTEDRILMLISIRPSVPDVGRWRPDGMVRPYSPDCPSYEAQTRL